MIKYIRLATFEPCMITTAEYDQIKKDIEARYIAGCSEMGDVILAKLIKEHEYRYHELKQNP